jgi:E-phenylitaconyl-CoA hydratase
MPVHFEVDGNVAIVEIHRPEVLNALDLDATHELRSLLQRYQDDPSLRCLVLTGAGKAFCTGADLKGTPQSTATYPEAMFQSKSQSAGKGLYTRPMDLLDLNIWKPVIAAINGHCLGGGLEIALQCDVRIAADAATLGLTEVCVGSLPAVSGVYRLTRAVGISQAMYMALTGERVSAARALECGLVTEVVAAERLRPRALEIARRIAGNAPLAVQAVKKLSRQAAHLSEPEAQELTELYWGILRDTQDRNEGRRAFIEKRAPDFQGR